MKARFLMLWTAAVIAAAASFVVHLTLRFETVRLGYDVGEARREQRRLLEARRLLSLEVATLSQPDRVEAVARGAFDMDQPKPPRIISMGESRSAERLSGGAR
jgi:cell division protein FtsL